MASKTLECVDTIYPNETYKREEESEQNNYCVDKLLVYGYVRNHKILQLYDDIVHIIYLYLLNIKPRSKTLLASLHLFASIIHNHMNLESNKCEFVKHKTDELNLLKYIFVRGGMCRDIVLNRNIKDIDLVVNIHDLSKQYLSHLIRFHSQKKQQHKDCTCILWKHYLNKCPKPIRHRYKKKDKEFAKFFIFESMITDADYLLNARFIKSLVFTTDLFQNAYDDISFQVFRSKDLNLGHYFNDLSNELVQFDIVDQSGCHDKYGAIVSMKLYQRAMGDEAVKKALKYIHEYKQPKYPLDHQNISIPIYPFDFTLNVYDCTINCLHIDLYHIWKDERIDLLWKEKICSTKYNSDVINKYNKIGYQHLMDKILIAPNLSVINNESADYYFWRLVKMVTKFIHKLIAKEWRLDESYLNAVISYYESIATKARNCRIFHTKCVYHRRGKCGNIDEIKTRFLVFRYIKFEQYLKSNWRYHSAKFKQVLLSKDIRSKYRLAMIQCFKDFEYHDMDISEIPKGYLDHLR